MVHNPRKTHTLYVFNEKCPPRSDTSENFTDHTAAHVAGARHGFLG